MLGIPIRQYTPNTVRSYYFSYLLYLNLPWVQSLYIFILIQLFQSFRFWRTCNVVHSTEYKTTDYLHLHEHEIQNRQIKDEMLVSFPPVINLSVQTPFHIFIHQLISHGKQWKINLKKYHMFDLQQINECLNILQYIWSWASGKKIMKKLCPLMNNLFKYTTLNVTELGMFLV